MAQKDAFWEIAGNRVAPMEAQREIVPVKKNNRYFERSAVPFPYDRVRFGTELSYEERLEEFRAGLDSLRERYRPFMSDYLPETATGTQVEELKEFTFRYLEEGEIFTQRDRADASWETVTVPDYRGPAGEDGKWKGYYRTSFICKAPEKDKRLVLQFQCVDYIARVYVNGCFAGSHEGIFAPFSFDITEYLKPDQENELLVECANDIPILGVGDVLDGDKIYAATGPGWDDSRMGWHHCPAGAGIVGRVTLEYRPVIFVNDVFVLPDIDRDIAQIRVGVTNYTNAVVTDYEMEVRLLPKNFRGDALVEYRQPIPYIGTGGNEYRLEVPLREYRLWEPESPWLYGVIVSMTGRQGRSCLVEQTGMRKFVSDEESTPRGRFYLNNQPIVLRGANEMGHLQQCVMKEDWEQLVDDILIAKLCHMNFYRVTQRPVQREIYDYFDMLGMMHQCDLPLFGFLRRPQFAEAVRQTVELEHLIRNHPSSVMVTFINEPMSIRKTQDPRDKSTKRNAVKGHRHLYRDELEAFFVAARQAVYTENPSRVVKNVEGDYEPPTMEGMPDFHCYTMWYSHHAIPIGKLLAGYLPPVKEGWMAGCGEYGAEGLDPVNVMKKYYPREWLACDGEGHWYPDKIVRAQTHSLHGDWYPEMDNMEDWVRASQIHQANATRLMTDAFRRRGDLINQTAIHLLIDAWPSGWMKTLVDCERVPKRAYFAYQDSLIPVRMNLCCGRKYVYGGERVPVEVWLLNDSSEKRSLQVQAVMGEQGYALSGEVEAASSGFLGTLEVVMPVVEQVTAMSLDGCMYDTADNGHGVLYGEKLEFMVYPSSWREEEGTYIELPPLTKANRREVEAQLVQYTAQGRTVVLTWEEKEAELEVNHQRVGLKKCQEVFFAAASPDYEAYCLTMLYNESAGYVDILGSYALDTQLAGEKKVFTYARAGFTGSRGAKEKLPFVEEFAVGAGKVLAVSLELSGRRGVNANLDALLKGKVL